MGDWGMQTQAHLKPPSRYWHDCMTASLPRWLALLQAQLMLERAAACLILQTRCAPAPAPHPAAAHHSHPSASCRREHGGRAAVPLGPTQAAPG